VLKMNACNVRKRAEHEARVPILFLRGRPVFVVNSR
jgi:hypothetical protein